MEFDEAAHRFLFCQLDKNCDGFIDYDSFKSALLKRAYFRRRPESDIDLIFDTLDRRRTGLISYEEFVSYARYQFESLKATFRKIDRNEDGAICVEDLSDASKLLGLRPDEDSIKKYIRRVSLRPNAIAIEQTDLGEFFHNLELSHYFNFDNSPLLDDKKRRYSSGPTVPRVHKAETEERAHNYPYKERLAVFLAGGVAGVISRTATAPADRMKVLIQSGRSGKLGIFDLAKSIYREGGYRAFFRGNYANVLKIAPETATKFFVFESMQPIICADEKNPTLWERFKCGALAGVASQAVIYPLEIAKTRLAIASKGEYRGINDCIIRTYQNEGITGMYRGCSASMLGVMPYAGVDLAIYTKLKATWQENHPGKKIDGLSILAIGAFSSICGQIVAYPLQVIRTRLQVVGLELEKSARPRTFRPLAVRPHRHAAGGGTLYMPPRLSAMSATAMRAQAHPPATSVIQVATEIAQTQGPRGFYKGITCNFMKSVPAISLTYLTYERSKQMFRTSLGCTDDPQIP